MSEGSVGVFNQLQPFAIAVHFKSDHPESAAADREVAFYQTNGIPFRTLRDGEALVLDVGGASLRCTVAINCAGRAEDIAKGGYLHGMIW